MKQMKAVQLLVLLVALITAAGCGGSNTNQGSQTGESKPTKGTTNEQAAVQSPETSGAEAAGERTIQHAMGTATIKGEPKRVVVLFNGMVDITVALGVKPAGAVESWEEKPWYEYLRASMDGVENLGEETQPNMEAIVALKPDLIIAAKSRHEKIYSQLKDIAPTIVLDKLFDWKANLAVAADALGKKDEAAKMMEDWNNSVADFKAKLGDKLNGKEMSIVRFESDGTARFYVSGFAGELFDELGLARPEAQQVEGKTAVTLNTKEQMGQLDGDYIFDISRTSEEDAKTKADWTSHPLWNNLRGVKDGNYFLADPIIWNLGGGSTAAKLLLQDLYTFFGLK
ncbi:putative siderophore-binding lipoprotein YfiY [Paenibacillus plantiphilus]|uniref:Siderophore-binding lipoprotein YfiY n=1 Tax=Paenibacillus plantiphilus TaxID=2905650 RepID=A0ABN8GBP6_9BACL|nr:iron-siderophore ABC transporter substrate-binding protein [Paenibacillus plantiphilus]CAH1197909.1 putative siderophore-binding lipoprotein YfiY [Paenibacillus plantiphilus]